MPEHLLPCGCGVILRPPLPGLPAEIRLRDCRRVCPLAVTLDRDLDRLMNEYLQAVEEGERARAAAAREAFSVLTGALLAHFTLAGVEPGGAAWC